MEQRNERTLAIIACGLGTRVQLFTGNNYIPKLLMNIGGKTILAKILEAHQSFEHVAIALSTQRHIDMVKQWVESNYDTEVSSKCIYVLHAATDGSANAVRTTLLEIYSKLGKHTDVCLHWSDVYAPMLPSMVEGLFESPENQITCATFNERSDKHLYLDYENNRVVDYAGMQMLRAHGIIANNMHLTIFGIYAFNAVLCNDIIAECENDNNLDFAKCMQKCGMLGYCVFSQKPLIDKYGDIEIYGDTESYLKYCDMYKKEKEVRYFNSIEIKDDVVVKTALCERGYKLMQNEVSWYGICAGNGVTCVPKVFSQGEHSFTMTKIDGITVKEYIDNIDANCECTPLAIGLMTMFEDQICSQLHNMQCYAQNIVPNVGTDVKLEAMLKEYVETTRSRYNEISELVKDITVWNGELLPDFEQLMQDIERVIKMTAKQTSFCFLHGDPHVCNMMIDKSGTTLTCIDPRGYFGDGKYKKVGDADYDIAKFAFGLSGNSNFARDAFHTLKTSNAAPCETALRGFVRGYDIDKLPLTNRQRFLVGLCWFKFPAWLKNNPVEAIITYCHGALMTRKYLDAWMSEL